jgi:hypothetical protein
VLDCFYSFILKIAVADVGVELGHGMVFKAIKQILKLKYVIVDEQIIISAIKSRAFLKEEFEMMCRIIEDHPDKMSVIQV